MFVLRSAKTSSPIRAVTPAIRPGGRTLFELRRRTHGQHPRTSKSPRARRRDILAGRRHHALSPRQGRFALHMIFEPHRKAAVESLSATWLTFVLPFALVGFGMGCVIAPLTTEEAMREVPAVLTGAASGLLNTSRQLGSAIGLAVIRVVLQNQLDTAMHDRAVTDSAQLPSVIGSAFINGFDNAASSGLQVGRGQSGAALPGDCLHRLCTRFSCWSMTCSSMGSQRPCGRRWLWPRSRRVVCWSHLASVRPLSSTTSASAWVCPGFPGR